MTFREFFEMRATHFRDFEIFVFEEVPIGITTKELHWKITISRIPILGVPYGTLPPTVVRVVHWDLTQTSGGPPAKASFLISSLMDFGKGFYSKSSSLRIYYRNSYQNPSGRILENWPLRVSPHSFG